MKKMLLLGVLVTLVLGWVSLSYKTQDVPKADIALLAPSSQTGRPWAYEHIKARTLCAGTNFHTGNSDAFCDPDMVHNYFALAGDAALCILAGALTSLIGYRLSRSRKLYK